MSAKLCWAAQAMLSCVGQVVLGNASHAHLCSTSLALLQFTKAVESKQVAQQEAERARFVVMKADQVCTQPE